MRYNALMNSHFSACVTLAYAHDHCRNRDVMLKALPGEFDHIGVTDGTDSWIAPVITEGRPPFGCDVRALLNQLREHGHLKTPPIKPEARQRRTMAAPAPVPTPAPARRTLHTAEAPAPVITRRRLGVTA